jgi:hypothetical protein
VAKRNGITINLTADDLRRAAAPYLSSKEETAAIADADQSTKMTTLELIKHSFSQWSFVHITALFSTPRLAYSSSLIIFCYAALGLGYPLFNGFLGGYLATKNASLGVMDLDATYAAYTYQAACGIPGSLAAALLVNWSRGGRKFAMAFFTVVSGVVLFGLTQSKTTIQVNALISIASFFQNAFCECRYPFYPGELELIQ